jgi:ribosome modulation factor
MSTKPTPDELSLEQALTEGMHAGLMGRAWSLNPYQSNQPEHAEWERGRRMAEACSIAGSFC